MVLLLLYQPTNHQPTNRMIIVGSITGNTNTLAGNVPPKADLGDLSGLTTSASMIDGKEFDGAKAYKDSKVRWVCERALGAVYVCVQKRRGAAGGGLSWVAEKGAAGVTHIFSLLGPTGCPSPHSCLLALLSLSSPNPHTRCPLDSHTLVPWLSPHQSKSNATGVQHAHHA